MGWVVATFVLGVAVVVLVATLVWVLRQFPTWR